MSYGQTRDAGRRKRTDSEQSKEAGKEQGYRVLSYLLAGIVLYGGIGWLLDRWLNTGFLLPAGVILGAACSIYLIIRRFGGGASEQESADQTSAGPKSKRKEGSTSWENRPSA